MFRTVPRLVYEQHRSLLTHFEPVLELCLSPSKLLQPLEVCPRHYLSAEFCASAPGVFFLQTSSKLRRRNPIHELLPGPFDSQDKHRSVSHLRPPSTTLLSGNA
ncbi:hypothetical protein Mapa_008157 [Marchantia paleacea]|nr:hypothetical protein Mapa_008157 [Marchantia paleacea]